MVFFSCPSLLAEEGFVPKVFRAQFFQEYKSALKNKMVKGEGRIEYLFPGHVRLEMHSPDEILLVSNPQMTYYYTPPLFEDMEGTLKKEKTKKTSLSYFFDLLKFGLNSNKYYEVLLNKEDVRLTFKKDVSEKMQLLNAILHFSDNKSGRSFDKIRSIDLIYLDKRKVTIRLKKLETSITLTKDDFQFNEKDVAKGVKKEKL